MYQVKHVNAKEDQLWKWFRFPGSDAEFELKLITRDELLKGNAAGEVSAFADHVGRHWFRNFKNLMDANKVAIPNTEENRVAILQDLGLWAFIQEKILKAVGWNDEGKDDSGSAS